MSEKGKKIDDEEKTIPRPEGYTIVKYAEGWMDFIVLLLGTVIAGFAIYALRDVGLGTWLVWVIFLGVLALLWVIGRKITEVKVNLKITDEGLEQTRLSGSSFCPDYRMIRWEDMRRYHLNGRSRNNNFLISVRGDTDFRISIPLHTLFEKQKDNWENFAAFRNDFWGIAPEHDVHRAFFG